MSQKEAQRPGLLRLAESGKVTNSEGASAAGVSVRQFRRWRKAFRAEGVAGLLHGNRGRPSPRRMPAEERERIVRLMVGKYAGVNDSHLTEKLRTVERLPLSRELVRRLRIEAKLPAKRKRRAPKHRSRRERVAREGMRVLIDGSAHDWLEGRGPRFTLVGAIDDATGRILALIVREVEDMHGYLAMLEAVLRQHGVPLEFYGDRFSALVRNDNHWSLEEQLAGEQRATLFGRILRELGVTFIAAQSPQAKGRVERMWGTLQDRLVSELRLLGLTTPEQVSAHLPRLIAEHNASFARPAREAGRAWRAAPRNLEHLLACRYDRKVARDNTVTLPGRWFQLPPRAHGRSWQGCSVEVRECLDGSAFVFHRDVVIARQAPPEGCFTLVHRDGPSARKRCPENFSEPPERSAPAPERPQPRNRRGHLTNMRNQAADHPWRKKAVLPQPAAHP
jgi:transposase